MYCINTCITSGTLQCMLKLWQQTSQCLLNRSNRNTTAVEILCTVHGLRFGHLKLIDKMVNQGFKTQQ